MDNIKLFKEFYTENATIVISEPFNFKYFTDTEEKFYKVGFNSFIVPDEFEGIITDDDYAEIKDGKLYIHFNYFPTNYHKNLNKNFITDWITDNFIHDAEEENYSEYFEVNPGEPLIIVADYKGKEIEF